MNLRLNQNTHGIHDNNKFANKLSVVRLNERDKAAKNVKVNDSMIGSLTKSNLWSYFKENVGNLIREAITNAAGVIELK